ncbi:MAG: response regulator [Treponema sp.]|nr:response regulator [Candidatus Treponema caballi]
MKENDIISRVSHELRTPLTSIMGLNQIIHENPTDEACVADCSKKIATASEFLLSLVNNIITLEEFEGGKAVLDQSQFNLRKMIASVVTVYESASENEGLNFSYTESENFPEYVQGDKNKLSLIINNILSNAVRFNKRGGHIDFTAEDMTGQGVERTFRFAVSDSGIGISEEMLPHLFSKYETADAAPEYQTLGGAGVGLTVANEAIKLMGSSIHVRSTEGAGSTFWFDVTLPVVDAEEIKPVDSQHDLEGKTILVAEDNMVNSHIVRHLLESFGCIVETATNGKDALALFSASEPYHYDAIIMDIRMPVMDGLEATKKIRALGGEGCYSPDALEIPIIALTANALDEDRKETMEAGMNAHLTKPIDAAELFTVLAAYMRKD